MQSNNNMKLTELEIFQSLMENLIRQELPNNWSDLNLKEQEKFIKDNVIKPLKEFNSLELISLTEIASSALVHLLEEKGIEVSD
ncbi:MAG: hypothetical protein QNJ70_20180 [Xenococcaceae cyanobacterium MO_207.B15]|nr:hypothetical protein [Xenococcaceae cyanobacterium MO_207.B15]MDJ0747451.1 hypothetical protein [Xenococcaceae cyanobacterium MO_167.B27]